MIEFKDRRPEPSTSLRLTKRQRELVQNFEIGEPDEKGRLVVDKDNYKAVLAMSKEMMDDASDWTPEYRGVRLSAKNLNNKVVQAVSGAVRENCHECKGDGCRHCYGTGRRLR